MSNPFRQIEWRSLIEVAGPFLADAVLEKAFPQGLEKLETPRKQRVRSAYDEWCEAVEDSDPQLAELHVEWLRLVLEDLLEYDATVLKAKLEFPETIRYQHPQTESPVLPDMVVMAGDKPRLLITLYPPGTKLESPLADQSWLASPLERMTLLCRAAEVSLGLVTNGEQWTLVSAPVGETSSTASWFARIWQQEPITLQAFQSLLGVRRMFGPANETLEALLLESLQHLDEVTDTLGSQVRRAVEVLVQALDRADLDRDRQLLKDVSPAQLYEAGLTVMMRLVFTLCAEERKLLLLGEPIYDQHYAISTLRARLNEDREQLGEDVLERRHDAWSRLLAVFRAIYGGIEHETLRLPPLGGSIFDPDRYPFLEGRASGTSWVDTPASPLPIDNRTVLLLLNALQVLEQRTGARLLSYLALDVEQIGHVYEGLLERTVKKVPETTLGLIGSQKAVNPNILLREMEEAKTVGADRLLSYVLEKTERSEAGVRNCLAKPMDEALYHRILLACGGDIKLANRIKPFGSLIRSDNWGEPLVYREKAYMVTLGADRRETGTHYTPKTLTEPIVQHTLEPLVYVGPAEGKPREEWKLKSPAQLLALKVCDMAMGSGAFLVQTCRYLGDRLVEVWDAEEKAGRVISIEGVVLEQLSGTEQLPREKDERVLIARRLIASRCLYGVDINPMAVELAKLSLWLVTMMKGRPFNFLDHALKCGDSLLGVSTLQQIENFSLRPGNHQTTFATADLFRYVDEATSKRRALEDLPSNNHSQIETKNLLHAEAETGIAKVKAIADCLISLELRGIGGDAYDDARETEAGKVLRLMKFDAQAGIEASDTRSEIVRAAREGLHGRRAFHWPVEFPEVFERGGFDAFVGNPPFLGGRRISTVHGDQYERFLKTAFERSKGSADLCCYFFRRAFSLIGKGCLGLLATNSLAEADSKEVGLQAILDFGGVIYRARTSFKWPGTAGVIAVLVHVGKQIIPSPTLLDEIEVLNITADLASDSGQRPYRFALGLPNYSQGTTIGGDGFILTVEEYNNLVSARSSNRNVLRQFLNGELFNNSYDFSPQRYVIDFGIMELPEAKSYEDVFALVHQRVKQYREGLTRQVHETRFWLFWDKREKFYKSIRCKSRVLLCPRVSGHLIFGFSTTEWVFSEQLKVFDIQEPQVFAVLQSNLHECWARKHSSTLGLGLRYSTSDAFDTFVFPVSTQCLSQIADSYLAHRQIVMLNRKEGFTKTYNRFHDQDEHSEDIERLRALHVEMDQAVAAAYGWSDLDLGHGFHVTKQGERYTLSESARRNVLDRLLALNHQRYEEEVKAGLHDKKGAKRKEKPQKGGSTLHLL